MSAIHPTVLPAADVTQGNAILLPAGVLPQGNAILLPAADVTARARCRAEGLGALGRLDDEAVLRILDSFSVEDAPRALAALACASKAMRAFATHEDLWKAAVLCTYGGDFRYSESWMRTFALTASKRRGRELKRRRVDHAPSSVGVIQTPIFSDTLSQRYVCASMELEPEWLCVSSVPEATDMSVEEFRARFEVPNIPVVLRGGAATWPAIKKWNREWLSTHFGGTKFTAGGYDMALSDFLALCDNARDDVPLYLFDPRFGEKAPDLVSDYSVPPHFGNDDLFKLLGGERPDYRWLIIGPARSGSNFHKDPNATSAWNAVVSGRKKWVLFPPHVTPPGVHPSHDGAHVATPFSLVEWFSNFYQFAYDGADGVGRRGGGGGTRPLETVCEPGDILFVPSGWWHLALNLEPCVAVTQNFVSLSNLPKVLALLDTRSAALVSGLSRGRRGSLGEQFTAALVASADPALLAVVDAHEARKARRAQPSALVSAFSSAGAAADGAAAGPGGRSVAGTSAAFAFSFPSPASGSTA